MEPARSTFAVFATLVGGTIMAIGVALNFGTPDSQIGTLVRLFGAGCLVLHAPWAFRGIGRFAGLEKLQDLPDSALVLGVLAIVTVAGWLLPPSLPWMASVLAMLGAAVAIPRIVLWLISGRVLATARVMGFAGLLGCYMAAMVWNGYFNAVVVSAVARGQIHRDEFYHASQASMLQTYGVNSTGIDGLPYCPYHFGSHWMFAQWSKLLDVPVFFFYQLAFPVIFFPLLVHSILIFGLEISRLVREEASFADPRENILLWLLVVTVFIGFLPCYAGQNLWIAENGWTSESMCIAVSASLYLLATVLPGLCGLVAPSTSKSTAAAFAVACLLIPALWLLGATKVSVMLVLLAVASYGVLRFNLYRDWRSMALLLVAIAGGYLVFRSVINPYYATEGSKAYKLLGFVRNQVAEGWAPYFYLLFFVWYWIYLWLRLSRAEVRTVSDFIAKLKKHELLDFELATALTGAAAFPGLVMTSGDTYFFADYYRWPVLGLLLAYMLTASPATSASASPNEDTVELRRSRLEQLPLASMVVLVVALVSFGALLVVKTYMRIYELEQQNMALRGIEQGEGREQIKAALRRGQVGQAWQLLEDHQRRLEASPELDTNIRMVKLLCELNARPLSEKRHTALFIPKQTRAYWDLLDPGYRYWPNMTTPLIAPALSGLAMIWGYPDGEREFGAYGYDSFELPSPSAEQPDVEACRPEVCKRASALKFSQVLAILQQPDGKLEVVTWKCP